MRDAWGPTNVDGVTGWVGLEGIQMNLLLIPGHRETPPVWGSYFLSSADPVCREALLEKRVSPGPLRPKMGLAGRPEAKRFSCPVTENVCLYFVCLGMKSRFGSLQKAAQDPDPDKRRREQNTKKAAGDTRVGGEERGPCHCS
eukprot:gene16807-biopygen6345